MTASRCADVRTANIRPGGTISGPTIMALADLAMYVAMLGSIGWVPLAVTTSLNINFLRKPGQVALIADCQLIKLGKRLAVGEVAIRSDGERGPRRARDLDLFDPAAARVGMGSHGADFELPILGSVGQCGSVVGIMDVDRNNSARGGTAGAFYHTSGL